MKIGLIKAIKDKENRVGLTPEGVRYLARNGHEVLVEKGAGLDQALPMMTMHRLALSLSRPKRHGTATW
jgi:alanine dehydrogenase